ncbi:phenylalanine--tRNA ligase subunit beta [Ferribacterium limneticum]|uniref:phenylalanine--tRNA ligase subunit beta n=1 Tax=Ferribacterium limneticum TaxID=76259 RepID=UPI001CFB141E|nr:phenylalanine--tRNA ligase subunit beta [Ferribacterium limneticum]UCV29952.1 phenylalanine--tRNA ligase subunit beta [Ferribacterium limneticum]UCV33871.1 phenylalanine--tRNA ligase subunit beta [Ferribacterium limneticum]
MKFSESWLRTLVDPKLSSEELSHLLTMAGLEVEELDPVAPAFDSVVVAHVLEVVKHPDADRLNVCQVDTGNGMSTTIVCGAPNVAVGLKVPCALPGAKLPGDFTIKIAKVRGIESSGMLCSAKELGIAEEASGLLILPGDAPVGQSIREYLDLDDNLFELKLTPNRADCLSLLGIAREVGAITGVATSLPVVPEVAASIADSRTIVLDAPDACPLYCGRILKGVNAKAPTPEWIKRRLERSGIRAISALVDVTNYVMLELGQPLHAFDNTKLEGAVHARLAKPEEKLLLLNEQTIAVDADVLMIADDVKPLAMAGIMGGEESGITLDTSELFLESAFFAPKAIAGRARRYGFGSDASHRFERGVDFGGARRAIERATQLILDICGGQVGPVVEAKAALPVRNPVRLRTARAEMVLGLPLGAERIAGLFAGLDLSFVREGDDFLVTPPSWRFDMEIEEDLIEEIARLYGYDNIPSVSPRGPLKMLVQPEARRPAYRVRQMLADRGYQEVVNFAFVEAAWEADFAANVTEAELIRLANPIASQMAVMRSTLFGGLISNLVTNLKRKQTRVRLFEVGRTFHRDADALPVNGFRQPWRLAGLAFGGALPEGWGSGARKVDFYDVKGDIEALLAPAILHFEKLVHPALHPGRAARILLDGRDIGCVGELHPEWVQKYDLPQAPVVFELDFDAVKVANVPAYAELSKFPPVIRDLAIVVDQNVVLQTLLDGLKGQVSDLIQDIQLFDIYVGKGVPENKKSLAFRIVMQDTQRTLQDSEVDAAMQQLVSCFEQAFGAQLRA